MREIAARKKTIKMTRDNGDEIIVDLVTPMEMLELKDLPYVTELEIKDERGFPVFSNIYLGDTGGTTLIYFKEHIQPTKAGEIKEWDGDKFIAKKSDKGCEECAFNLGSCTTPKKTTAVGECETNHIIFEVIK